MNENSEKLLEKADYLIEIERWNEAIPLLLKVLAQNPEHFQANCLLALCHYSLRDFETALGCADRAVGVAPGEEWGHRLRSIVLSELDKKKEALNAAEEAVRLAPYEPFALQVLANSHLAVGNHKKAQEMAEKMREIAPESENSLFTLGNILLARGNNREAEICFREALRIDPNFADARNNLGVALLRQKDSATTFPTSSNLSIFPVEQPDYEIHKHFSEALRLEPNNRVAAENLRSQFSYLNVFFVFLFFLPFLFLAFFMVPGVTVFMTFLVVIGMIQQFWQISQNRRKLTPEVRMFLKASRKNFASRLTELSETGSKIVKKVWMPHLLAALAVGFRLFDGMPKIHDKTGWNDIAAFALFIGAVIWLVLILSKD